AAGVSVDAVKEAGYVEKHAPEEYKKIKAGRKSLHKAAKEAAKKQAGQQHDEALARIREVCGKDFAQAVDGAQVIALKQPKKAIAFAGLSDDHMKQLAPVLGMGWQYNRAIGFLGKEVTPAMTLKQVDDLFAFRGSKRMEFVLPLDDLEAVKW